MLEEAAEVRGFAVASVVLPRSAVDVLSGRGVGGVRGGLPLLDRGGLQAGVAGVLGEGGPREVRGARGSLRTRGQAEALRRVWADAGVGRVQRPRGTDAGGAADEALSSWRFTALLRHSEVNNVSKSMALFMLYLAMTVDNHSIQTY